MCRTKDKPLSERIFGWPLAVFRAYHKLIAAPNGLDAYFFVRFLRMIVRMLLPIWLLSWIVLMPVTSVNTGVQGHTGLDLFVFGNVANTDQDRYAAHIIIIYICIPRGSGEHGISDLTPVTWTWM